MIPEIIQEIANAAHAFNIDPILIHAMVEHESNGAYFKPRFEPTWRYLYLPSHFAEVLGISANTEMTLQAMSWGPLQIMGSVARELGYKDDLPKLCSPLGLTYGCMKLRRLLDHYANEEDAISAYNQGSPKKTPGGQFLNAKNYVDPIARRLRELRALI